MSEEKTPQQILFRIADNIITNEGKHVFLKILCDNMDDREALNLLDELITHGL